VGTSPGKPGSAGGIKAALSLGVTAKDGVATISLSASASAESAGAGTGSASGPAVPSYLNFNKVAEVTLPASLVSSSISAQTFGAWLTVDLAVSKAQADSKTGTWADVRNGADVAVLAQASAGFLGSTIASASAALSSVGGIELKGFEGLGKGTKKIK
jgi:hypothetical protein